MTSPAIASLQRRIGRFPIELPAALLMAAAVALAVAAVPGWRLESAVAATGLPTLVAAAAPPLGETARTIAAIALASLAFLLVWSGLRALDRRQPSGDFPAFRAADFHPDAPRRRPILAGAEFGVPNDELPAIETPVEEEAPAIAAALPSFLAPRQPAPIEEDTLELGTPERDSVIPFPEPAGESAAALMQRLEAGVARRGPVPPAPTDGGATRHELRRALGDLQRMAGSAG